jgi:predicted DNA-binding transcriptional regulator AlpA
MMSLLTPREVQARLRIGRNAVYGLVKAREISVVRLPGRKTLRFLENEIEDLVDRNTVPAKRNFFGSKPISHTTNNKGVAGVGQSKNVYE